MTDPKNGLTSNEVAKLRGQGLTNAPVDNQSKTVGQIIRSNIFTFFNFIFFFFAILLITAHSYVNLTFLIVVVINTAIGIIQELRSKQVLDKLTMLNVPKSQVIRDGKMITIATEDLVKGDLCIFSAGNQIGADARVVSGSVKVNEALVTGESDEINKQVDDTLLSGSFVVSGECRAVLTNVGAESYISKLTLEAKEHGGKKQTEMMRSLSKLLKIIGVVMVPIGIIMFIQDKQFLHLTYEQSIVAVVAALVGMIPEGLYLLTSMRLAVSATGLGLKKVLVHEMESVETLARVDVLCLDKTGTLTENTMSFEALIPLDGFDEDENEEISLSGRLDDFVANMSGDNVTINTLKKSFGLKLERKAEKIYPFTSAVKYSAVAFNDEAYVLGAPEKLLKENFAEYEDRISEFTNIGNRVLLFGRLEDPSIINDGEPLPRPVKPLGLVLLTNPVRKTAKSTMKFFQDEGVNVKVISGDNPATVGSVAMKAGIKNADKVVDASTLTTKEEIDEAVRKYTVFGRVLPAQKKMIVQSLQADGHVVAMTGDGVNDVLALKTADCSIAMGQASEVVENISQIVLLDSDFSKMPSVVAEGRQVVNNIQRSASLFLVKNIFSILTAIFVIFAGNRFPLYPTQLSLYSLVVVGIPSFFLALQPSNELIKGKFLPTVLKRALPAAIAEFIMVEIASLVGAVTHMTFDQTTTMSLVVMLVIGVMFLIHISQPMDKFRMFIVGLAIFCCVGGVAFFKPLFKISVLSWWMWTWTAVISIIGIFVFAIILQFVNKVIRIANQKENKNSWLSRTVHKFIKKRK